MECAAKVLMSGGEVPSAFDRTAKFTDGWMSTKVFPNEFREGWSKAQSLAPSKGMTSSLCLTMNLNEDSSKTKSETVDHPQRTVAQRRHSTGGAHSVQPRTR
jgi:hypothetical protein